MSLKDTVHRMKEHLAHISKDLEKAGKGNKAASQRVRTGTIKFAKIAKTFRKESVMAEKGMKKRGGKKAGHKKKTHKKKHHHKKKTHHKRKKR